MKRRILILVGFLVTILMLLALPALHSSKAAPEVSAITSNWHVISSGGTSYSTSGPITLGATIGQSQAGPLNATGYWVQVGFWIEEFLSLYLPIIIK